MIQNYVPHSTTDSELCSHSTTADCDITHNPILVVLFVYYHKAWQELLRNHVAAWPGLPSRMPESLFFTMLTRLVDTALTLKQANIITDAYDHQVPVLLQRQYARELARPRI